MFSLYVTRPCQQFAVIRSRGDLEPSIIAARMTTNMADEEEKMLRHAQERCDLLIRIKSTVDGLLASGSINVWSTYGGLSRITGDLEDIFRHGLREQQVRLVCHNL